MTVPFALVELFSNQSIAGLGIPIALQWNKTRLKFRSRCSKMVCGWPVIKGSAEKRAWLVLRYNLSHLVLSTFCHVSGACLRHFHTLVVYLFRTQYHQDEVKTLKISKKDITNILCVKNKLVAKDLFRPKEFLASHQYFPCSADVTTLSIKRETLFTPDVFFLGTSTPFLYHAMSGAGTPNASQVKFVILPEET